MTWEGSYSHVGDNTISWLRGAGALCLTSFSVRLLLFTPATFTHSLSALQRSTLLLISEHLHETFFLPSLSTQLIPAHVSPESSLPHVPSLMASRSDLPTTDSENIIYFSFIAVIILAVRYSLH